MNWFKRYGIVGANFLFVVTLWFKSISSFSLTKGQETLVVALFTFTFLPIGYLLSVISQFLYYKKLSGHCMHQKFIKNDLDDSIRQKLNLENMYSEEIIAESILTCRLRLDDTNNLDRIKYLAEQVTKRFDVIAINKAIILSVLISPFIAFFLVLFTGVSKYTLYCGRLILVSLMSAITIPFLMGSNSVMYKQIKIFNRYIADKFLPNK